MPKKVLIVDDEKTVLNLLKIFLGKAGFDIELAEDGVQAIEKNASFAPDVLVLDTNMPNKSGLDVCRELKAQNPDKPKIIMHTATLEAYKEKAEAAGCDATFGKTGMAGMSKLIDLINSL